jgi:amino acid transporter
MQEILLSNQFITTFLVFLLAFGGIGGLVIYERKPRESLNPKMLPSTALMLVIGIVALLALVHLVNLLGIHTGR